MRNWTTCSTLAGVFLVSVATACGSAGSSSRGNAGGTTNLGSGADNVGATGGETPAGGGGASATGASGATLATGGLATGGLATGGIGPAAGGAIGVDPAETWRTMAPSGSPVNLHGTLRADGNRIVGYDGAPAQVRGMSLYWSQQDSGSKYYNPGAIGWLVDDWNMQIVRVAVGVTDDGGFKGPNGDYLDNPTHHDGLVDAVVQAAFEKGIYVLIDWHDHHAHHHVEQAKAFFSKMAEKYGDRPNVIYEIWNEPRGPGSDDPGATWDGDIQPYAQEISSAIRQHDPDNLMVVGTPFWDQKPADVIGNEVDDPNVAYSLHFYAGDPWHAFSRPGGIGDSAQQALDAGLPLFATEWGTTHPNNDHGSFNETETRTWMQFLDQNAISSCNWSVTDLDEGSAALTGASPNGGWSDGNITQSGHLVRSILLGE